MLVAVLLVIGCGNDNSFRDTEIGDVGSERLYETGEIEFDLTYSGAGNSSLTSVSVEVTIWTYPDTGGDLGAGTNMPVRSRSAHDIEFKTRLRKRRVVLKIGPADRLAKTPYVEAEVRLVGVGTRGP